MILSTARGTWIFLLGAVVAAGLLVALPPNMTSASAHGTLQNPSSRIYNCRFINVDDPLCQEAWNAEPQALYDWMEINIGDADSRHRERIPDGRLCSANRDKYAAFDTPSQDWRATKLEADPDGKYTFGWTSTAPHATKYYRIYLTKQGYEPSQPLAWDDLELVHDSGPSAAAAGVTLRAELPARTGKQVLYTIWQRSDSTEAFYSCSDVTLNSSQAPKPTETTSPTESVTPTPAPEPTVESAPALRSPGGVVKLVKRRVGSSKATFTWKKPRSDGGATITKFETQINIKSTGKNWQAKKPKQLKTNKKNQYKWTWKKLKSGRNYTAKIRARNSVGAGKAVRLKFKTKS
jgi:predicted carbohydrate-binding protein with CBM5 and CBM33 domain